ncbi:MAG TPA: citrate/2-methylcitrate synthase, partial [Methanomassiliicoccales archaeon]|nr:citrate/2-methylcitrate synthase [Methanomassiliicoccales archaeon]
MTGNSSKDVVRGLKDVAAAETRISYIDPSGSLYYLGYDIDDLIGHVVYAEVAYLLIHKRFPNKEELESFNSELIANMRLPEEIVDSIRCTP